VSDATTWLIAFNSLKLRLLNFRRQSKCHFDAALAL
jgi:hypothetical protein